MGVIIVMVRYEDEKWINGIGVYFFLLEEVNETLFKLITYKYNNVEEIKILFFDLVVNINRLIPMKGRKISYEDGILRLSKYFDFLNDDFSKIYDDYSNELINMNDVRNKFEHVPHVIKWTNYIGGSTFKKIRFINEEYNNDIIECNESSIEKRKKRREKLEWVIDTNEIIKIMIDINNIFIKIQYKLKNYFENNKVALEYPYIKKINSIDFIKYINRLKELCYNAYERL